jgi:hypothetical protein
MVWQFFVIRKISDSIRDELNTPIGDSIFADGSYLTNQRPTFNAGMSYATLFCISVLPLMIVQSLAALAGMIMWIVYWVQLYRYKK